MPSRQSPVPLFLCEVDMAAAFSYLVSQQPNEALQFFGDHGIKLARIDGVNTEERRQDGRDRLDVVVTGTSKTGDPMTLIIEAKRTAMVDEAQLGRYSLHEGCHAVLTVSSVATLPDGWVHFDAVAFAGVFSGEIAQQLQWSVGLAAANPRVVTMTQSASLSTALNEKTNMEWSTSSTGRGGVCCFADGPVHKYGSCEVYVHSELELPSGAQAAPTLRITVCTEQSPFPWGILNDVLPPVEDALPQTAQLKIGRRSDADRKAAEEAGVPTARRAGFSWLEKKGWMAFGLYVDLSAVPKDQYVALTAECVALAEEALCAACEALIDHTRGSGKPADSG